MTNGETFLPRTNKPFVFETNPFLKKFAPFIAEICEETLSFRDYRGSLVAHSPRTRIYLARKSNFPRLLRVGNRYFTSSHARGIANKDRTTGILNITRSIQCTIRSPRIHFFPKRYQTTDWVKIVTSCWTLLPFLTYQSWPSIKPPPNRLLYFKEGRTLSERQLTGRCLRIKRATPV